MIQTLSNGDIKFKIILEYAQWTVLSALRRGSPIRSNEKITAALGIVDFSPLFDMSLGSISPVQFEKWHQGALEVLVTTPEMAQHYGWAAKMINVYLKTAAYVSGMGRHGLAECLHPPIDSGLWNGLRQQFSGTCPLIIKRSHAVTTISGIKSLGQYQSLINALRELAQVQQCSLFELEQYWIRP
jgi:hypothetical protein